MYDRYYWTTREAAIGAGAYYADRCMVTAELEPFNGWVCILHPYDYTFFMVEDIAHIVRGYEIAFDRVKRLRQRPREHRPPPPAPSKETETPVEAKWKPGQKLPWE